MTVELATSVEEVVREVKRRQHRATKERTELQENGMHYPRMRGKESERRRKSWLRQSQQFEPEERGLIGRKWCGLIQYCKLHSRTVLLTSTLPALIM